MVHLFNDEEASLLRRVFARSVEDPLCLRDVSLAILGPDPSPPDLVDAGSDSDLVGLLSRIYVTTEQGDDRLNLVDRVSAVMVVGYRRGFHVAANRAGLPISDNPMSIIDLYPGLQESCSQYSALEASTLTLQLVSDLAPLAGRKGLVRETLRLLRRALHASFLQGYRTGALAAEALRGGIHGRLAVALGDGDAPPDDPEQNRALGRWLGQFGWDDLQREILRHQTPSLMGRLAKVSRSPDLVGLPRAGGNWTRAEKDYIEDVLVAIALAGLRTGMRLQLQSATGRPNLPSENELRLTYRVSRSISLMARQWTLWHPAPAPMLRVRQVGEHLTAPTLATGTALGHMMGEVLGC